MPPRGGIRVGTFAGIPFGIHPLWLAIVALITWSLAVTWYPEQVDGIATGAAWALGLLSALLLFASIVAHEYGHAIVARRRGIEVEEIDLWLLGGVARMSGRPRRAQDELAYALAGPAVTLIVAVAFGLLLLVLPADAAPALRALAEYQLIVNTGVLVLNLLPAFPLDGGRVLHALLWRRSGDEPGATHTAARIGRAFGFGLIALGVLGVLAGAFGGLWFALIGAFIVAAAGNEELAEEVHEAFTGVPARAVMRTPASCVAADASADETIAGVALADPHPAYPVVDGGRVVGMLEARRLEQVPVAQRAATTVRDLADADPRLRVRPDDDVGALLELPAFQRMMRVAVVDGAGAPIGIVSVTDLQRVLEARRRFGTPVALPDARHPERP
jgi:Zn-dependent protease